MKKLFLAIAAVATLFATSCNKENTNAPEEPAVAGDNEFVCVIDQNVSQQNAPAVNDNKGTLAHIDGSNNVWWQEGDQIAYYGKKTTNGVVEATAGRYVLTCSKLSNNSAYFSIEGMHFYNGAHEAYYPASIMTLNGSNKVLTLPSTINLAAGKNAGQLPMIGTGNGSHLITFHNICAVLKIAIPANLTSYCNRIVLSATQPIAGTFTMSGTKAVLASSGTSKTITLNAPSGTHFSGTLYVAIPEGSYTNFTVEFFEKVENINPVRNVCLGTKTNSSAMAVEAGKIYPVTVSPEPYVDLGYSVKWATCNVGASYPWQYGNHYCWGGISTQTDYSWSSSRFYSGGYYQFTKYNYIDGLLQLAAEDDVAYQSWGNKWCMAYSDYWWDLINYCTWTWTSNYHGVAGSFVTSNASGYTDKSIFLPAAGYWEPTYLEAQGARCCYWSRTIDGGYVSRKYAWYVNMQSDKTKGEFCAGERRYGMSVRAVRP